MWERHLSLGPDGNSDQIKDGSWVMRSVRSHLFISTGGGYRIYTMASALMMLDVCHRQVRTACHRISDQSSKPHCCCLVWYSAAFRRDSESSTRKALNKMALMWKEIKKCAHWQWLLYLIFLISSSLKETSWCFCSIVKTSNIKDPKEKVLCWNNSFINIFPLCQSCDRGHFLKYISALSIMQDEEYCLVTSVF